MGKTLKTVGAIVGGAVLIATGVGALVGVNVAAMGISTVTGSMTVGQLGTLASGLAAVGGMLDKPKSTGSGSPTDWTSNPDQPVPFLFGRMGIAGKIVHRDEFGPDDDMYQGVIGVLSGAGPIKGILGFKGDDQSVTFDGNGKAITSQWKDEMWMRYRLGTQPDLALTSPPGLKDGAVLPDWGPNHKLSGKACYMQVLAENSKGTAYQWREPDPLHEAEGIFGWDPRFDSTYPGGLGTCRFGVRATYRHLTDPIISGLNWSLGLVENGKVVGGIGASPGGVDIDSFVQAANVSAANNWIIAAWPDTSEDVSQVLGQMLQAGGATRARNAGRISCVTRGAVLPSVVTITAADLAGPIELDTGASLFNRLNTITPKCMSEAHKWQHVAGSPVTFPDLVAEDGGEHADQIDYRFVPVTKQAAELAALDILDGREPFSGTVPLKPHLRRLKPGSRFTIDAPGLLLDGVKCMVLGRSYTVQTGEVRVSFRSETDGKIALALGKTTTLPAFPNLSPAQPNKVTAPGPGDWEIRPRVATADGIQLPIWDLVGSVSSTTVTGIIVEFGAVPAEEDIDPDQPIESQIAWEGAWTGGPTATSIPVQGMQPGEPYYVSVTNVRGQNYSTRTLFGPDVVPGKKPPAPTGLNVESVLLPPDALGVQASIIRASWNAVSLVAAPDLAGYDTRYIEAGQPAITRGTVEAHDKWAQVQPEALYSVEVRSRSKIGAVSAWTQPSLVIGEGDANPPLPPRIIDAIDAALVDYEPPNLSELRADLEGQIAEVEGLAAAAGSAIAVETSARSAALLAEAEARTLALSLETSARQAAILAEATARDTAISGVQNSVNVVSGALAAEVTTRQGQISILNGTIASIDTRVTTGASDLAAFTAQTNTTFSSVGGSINFVLGLVTTVATDLEAETATRSAQTSSLGASLALVETDVSTLATDLAAETVSRTAQVSTLGASIAGVESDVDTVATALAAETATRTTQYSALDGSLAQVFALANTTATNLAAEVTTRQGQISTLNGNVASIDTRVTTTATDLQAFTTQTNTSFSSVGGSISFVLGLVNTVSTDLAAETATRSSQVSSLNGSVALVDGRVTTVATALAAETTTRQGQISTLNGNIASVESLAETTATDLTALSIQTNNTFSGVGGSIAFLQQLISANATSISAETLARQTLSATVGTNSSAITALQVADVTEAQARAAAINTLTANFNGLSSTVSVQAVAISGLQAQDNIARFDLAVAAGGGRPARFVLNSAVYGSSAAILADQIWFGDNTYFDDATDQLRTTFGTDRRAIALGASFGGANALTEWKGSASVPFGSETKANATFYQSDVSPFIGGAALPVARPVLAVSVSPEFLNATRIGLGSATTATATVVVTGGTGPYTYRWLKLGGDESFTGNGSTGNSSNFTGTITAPGQQIRATFGCVVRDAAGATATAYVEPSIVETS